LRHEHGSGERNGQKQAGSFTHKNFSPFGNFMI
jgi:hypothetical protein